MITSEMLTNLLKVLESGVPANHPTRQDARIAQLEEAIKMLIGHVLSLGENPSDGVITQGPGPDPTMGPAPNPAPALDPTMGPNPTWLQT